MLFISVNIVATWRWLKLVLVFVFKNGYNFSVVHLFVYVSSMNDAHKISEKTWVLRGCLLWQIYVDGNNVTYLDLFLSDFEQIWIL
jgi:hypothetical protein